MTSLGIERRQSIDIAAAAIMLGLTFSWGLNGVAAKLTNTGYDPVFAVLARSALASVLIFFWCRLRGIPLFERDGTLMAGIVAGVLFGAEFALMFIGLDFTSVARGTLLINTMPFWVLIGGHFLLGEHMSARKFAGLAFAFVGVALVFSDKLSLPTPDAIVGDVLNFLAGILWAATTLVIRRSRLQFVSAEKVLLYQLVVSAIVMVPLLALAGPPVRDGNWLATGAMLFQAFYVVGFTYVVWFWLMGRYPASGLTSFAFLSPVFGVLCGALLLDEPLSWRIFAALLMVVVGLIIVNRPARQKA
jgi:drug/metabolite transporter (DMT)-like permease